MAALLLGTALAWAGGQMSAPDVTAAARDITIALPAFHFHLLPSVKL